jgi:hypothetical protein
MRVRLLRRVITNRSQCVGACQNTPRSNLAMNRSRY